MRKHKGRAIVDWSLPKWKKPKKPVEDLPQSDLEHRKTAQRGGLAKAQQTRRRKKMEQALIERGNRETKNKE